MPSRNPERPARSALNGPTRDILVVQRSIARTHRASTGDLRQRFGWEQHGGRDGTGDLADRATDRISVRGLEVLFTLSIALLGVLGQPRADRIRAERSETFPHKGLRAKGGLLHATAEARAEADDLIAKRGV